MTSNTKVWDLPTRIFHWALAASFAGAYVLSESERLRNVHVALGYTVLGLLAFRLVWGFIGPRYARFSSFVHSPVAAFRYLRDEVRGCAPRYVGHNPAGSWAVFGHGFRFDSFTIMEGTTLIYKNLIIFFKS